ADKSPVAGLPSGRKCMGCHKFVAKDNPVVMKLAARVAAGEPLRWLRVFAVPDFIYFSHRMHVRKNVACSECHGDMAAHKAITQSEPFTMGRCLACHNERGATRDCLGCHK
ncbi:MAG TPA: cytochrome c3 family protein, partial [Kofleriaceae bacterium]|nr:cytochrome c3 family protein [Kofleriaceae bacterium]